MDRYASLRALQEAREMFGVNAQAAWRYVLSERAYRALGDTVEAALRADGVRAVFPNRRTANLCVSGGVVLNDALTLRVGEPSGYGFLPATRIGTYLEQMGVKPAGQVASFDYARLLRAVGRHGREHPADQEAFRFAVLDVLEDAEPVIADADGKRHSFRDFARLLVSCGRLRRADAETREMRQRTADLFASWLATGDDDYYGHHTSGTPYHELDLYEQDDLYARAVREHTLWSDAVQRRIVLGNIETSMTPALEPAARLENYIWHLSLRAYCITANISEARRLEKPGHSRGAEISRWKEALKRTEDLRRFAARHRSWLKRYLSGEIL